MSKVDEVLQGGKGGCLLEIIVTPGARSEGVGKIDGWRGRLEVRVREKALDNRANKAVLRLLEGFFGLPRGGAELVKGARGTRKTVKLEMDRGEAEGALKRHTGE